VSPTAASGDEDRLRRDLAAIAGETSELPVDASRLAGSAVAAAHRVRVRRRFAAAAGAGLLAAAVTAGVVTTGSGGSKSAPPAGPQPTTLASPPPSPTPSTSAATTATSTSPSVDLTRLAPTQEGSLSVHLTVSSGPGSASPGVYVARWVITWSGGDAPVDFSLLYDGGVIRARSMLSVSCTDPKRNGRLEGQVDVTSPGPHRFAAVVRAHRCNGTVQRSIDVRYWTWTGSSTS